MLADHYDAYLEKTQPGSRSLCGHSELNAGEFGNSRPFSPGGCFDGKVVNTAMARQMSFAARWGAACGTPFYAKAFLAKHPQFDWMKGILKDRPREPWVEFSAGGR
jgi:hypothetical protein